MSEVTGWWASNGYRSFKWKRTLCHKGSHRAEKVPPPADPSGEGRGTLATSFSSASSLLPTNFHLVLHSSVLAPLSDSSTASLDVSLTPLERLQLIAVTYYLSTLSVDQYPSQHVRPRNKLSSPKRASTLSPPTEYSQPHYCHRHVKHRGHHVLILVILDPLGQLVDRVSPLVVDSQNRYPLCYPDKC